ncbi:alpha/beta hydrolase [Congregibacter variabilis]|uniref:Alpha/beta hydrolase n=1 Tax=Congregibacter variabilis TaxID=3081200 RepID=A0ABZ0I7R5_9GAMM|nr:alpha/beta hydrolase [Congregibacter sp. IMCC43200]
MKRSSGFFGFTLFLVILAAGLWLWTPDKPRSELEALYLAKASDLRDIDGVRLHLRVQGSPSAPVLIMLHGFGASLHTWDGWAAELDDEFRVIRFDLPGSGLSYPDPGNDYSDERALQLICALMDELAVDRAAFIGNSIGGRLAWRMAATYPQRVSALVLVSPDGFASKGFEYSKPAEVPYIMNLMRYVLPKHVLRMNLAPAYADASKLDEAVVTRYHDLMLAPGSRDALLQRLTQTVLVDPQPLLKQISVAVLLLWGESDRMIPIENAADYQRVLPDSRLVPLPKLGHVPQEEDPLRSLPPVRTFLQSALLPAP